MKTKTESSNRELSITLRRDGGRHAEARTGPGGAAGCSSRSQAARERSRTTQAWRPHILCCGAQSGATREITGLNLLVRATEQLLPILPFNNVLMLAPYQGTSLERALL